MDSTYSATCITLLIFIASVISVEVALSAAIIEITAGVIAGNFLGLHPAPWMDFLAGFGGILLTFLAGAEVDPELMKQKLAVLIETGLTNTPIGKLIMASTFVTDIGTALALSLTFAEGSIRTLWFFIGSAILIVLAPRYLPKVFERYGPRVIEPEIKLLFFLLFLFMSLGKWGRSHAVLPVFVLGLCLAKMFHTHKDLQRKLRIVAFAMITPFFFIKGGMSVSLSDLTANCKLLFILFGVKTAAKFIGVWPLARRYANDHAAYTTLLMSTGLTFGTISSLYGLQAGYINSTQFSILVAVVIGTAVIPTFIAQRWFSPTLPEEIKEEMLAEEAVNQPACAVIR